MIPRCLDCLLLAPSLNAHLDRLLFQTLTLECSLSKCIHKWNNQIVFPSFEQIIDTPMNSKLLISRFFYLVKNSEELLR